MDKIERQLKAIMFSDIKSFSAMMGKDEIKTVALVKEHREIIRKLIDKYQGEERGTAGDSFFILFSSTYNAVQCAIDIQKHFHLRNGSLPIDQQIWIRIGIHVGDILVDPSDNQFYGDGINIAARTEPLAEPGGICITHDVYLQVHKKIPLRVIDIGRKEMKNIVDAPTIYRIVITVDGNDPNTSVVPPSRVSEPNKRSLVRKWPIGIVVFFLVAGASVLMVRHQFVPDRPRPDGCAGRPLQVRVQTEDTAGSEVAVLAMKIEREFVEHFVRSGVAVTSASTARQPTGDASCGMVLSLRGNPDNLTLGADLLDLDNKVVSSTTLSGDIAYFSSIRKVLPAVVSGTMDIDDSTLAWKRSSSLPTRSPEALSFYLLARQEYRANNRDAAIDRLNRATEIDNRFAMAFWTLSMVYTEAGDLAAARANEEKALSIDPDHPRWPFVEENRITRPLPAILEVSRNAIPQNLGDGFVYRSIPVEQYGLALHVWSVQPGHHSIRLATQSESTGVTASSIRASKSAVLAVNGGFFEKDAQRRLTPSGLLVVDGQILQNVTTRGGSGVFYIRGGKPEIAWSRDVTQDMVHTFEQAVQSGPLLVEPGGVMGIKSNDANRLNRSAICLREGETVFVVVSGTNGLGLSLYELAEWLAKPVREGGLECDSALNLDGGPSTQFHFAHAGKIVSLDGIWPVQNALVVMNGK